MTTNTSETQQNITISKQPWIKPEIEEIGRDTIQSGSGGGVESPSQTSFNPAVS